MLGFWVVGDGSGFWGGFGGWFRGGEGGIGPCARGDLADVWGGVSGGVAHGPAETAGEDIVEERVGPDVFAVAHGGVEDPAFAVGAGPCGGEGRAFVFVAFHGWGVLEEEDVEVIGEVLEGVPFLVEFEGGAEGFHAWEGWVDDGVF